MGRGPWPVTRRNASLLQDTCRALYCFSASQEEEKWGFDVGRLSASRAGAMSRCHSGASVEAFIKELSALLRPETQGDLVAGEGSELSAQGPASTSEGQRGPGRIPWVLCEARWAQWG